MVRPALERNCARPCCRRSVGDRMLVMMVMTMMMQRRMSTGPSEGSIWSVVSTENISDQVAVAYTALGSVSQQMLAMLYLRLLLTGRSWRMCGLQLRIISAGCYNTRYENVLCRTAVRSICFLPIMVAISIKASTSSFDWNSGNFPVRKNRRIIPTDQTSIAIADYYSLSASAMKESTYRQSDLRISTAPRVHEILLFPHD